MLRFAGIAGNTQSNVFVCESITPTLGKIGLSRMFYLLLFGAGRTGEAFFLFIRAYKHFIA